MATITKTQDFVEQFAKGYHNFATDTFKIALTDVAPNATTGVALANITQITAANGYASGGTAITNLTVTESAGTATVAADQVVFTAVTGAMAQFRYYVLYNDTTAAPVNKPVVCFWDHGSEVNLAVGETFTIKFNGVSPSGTIFTLA